ncbi:hypothetical protein HFN66_29165 [Rhizobium laguerreae]|nr:hypothetical protein [Rhizobium laguerreae]
MALTKTRMVNKQADLVPKPLEIPLGRLRLSSRTTPAGSAGFSLRAKPSLPILRGNLGFVVIFMARHVIDTLTAVDAHITFDFAASGKAGKWSGPSSNFGAEVSDHSRRNDREIERLHREAWASPFLGRVSRRE